MVGAVKDKLNTSQGNSKSNTSQKGSKDSNPSQGTGIGKGHLKKNNVTQTDPSPISNPETPPTVQLDAYLDYLCINELTDLGWGEVEVGSSKSQQIYLKNNGDTDVLATLVTENWYPETSPTYISLDWDYSGQVIHPNEVLGVTLTISISNDCPLLDGFNFDIVIIGT